MNTEELKKDLNKLINDYQDTLQSLVKANETIEKQTADITYLLGNNCIWQNVIHELTSNRCLNELIKLDDVDKMTYIDMEYDRCKEECEDGAFLIEKFFNSLKSLNKKEDK